MSLTPLSRKPALVRLWMLWIIGILLLNNTIMAQAQEPDKLEKRIPDASTFVFLDSGQRLGSGPSWVVELGDMDGDGDLDAFVGNDYPERVEVWRNDGNGNFTDTGQRIGQITVRDIGVGDLNGDGHLDLIIVNDFQFADTVYLNDGAGNFQLHQTLDADSTAGVELGDLNNDGHLDAVVLSYNQHKVWLNNGTGTFTATGQSLGGGQAGSDASDVKLGDLNGDGSLDIALAMNGIFSSNQVWLNNGSGTFSQGQTFGNGDLQTGIGLADFDRDGDLDIFMKQVFLNNGSGVFVASSTGPNTLFETPSDIDIADFDQDGDPDILVSTSRSIFAIQNNGIGNNSDIYSFLGASSAGTRAAVGDLNGDGRPDIFMPDGPNWPPGMAPNQVWLNGTPAAPPLPPPTPRLQVSAMQAQPGSRILVEGFNLASSAQFSLKINGQNIQQSLMTGSTGNLQFGLDTTGGQIGDYFLVLQQTANLKSVPNDVGDHVSTFFTLSASAMMETISSDVSIYNLPADLAIEADEILLPAMVR
ncbi:MAG: VCBS repeat-containing protein [Chloroflexota bacterium]